MNGGRCGTCVYWREHAPGLGRGTCERITRGSSVLAIVTTAHQNGGSLNTAAAFGCVDYWRRPEQVRP